MTDLQILVIVLAVVYAWECLVWLRRGAVAFKRWQGPCWRAVHPGQLAGNRQGAFVVAPPLPPLGNICIAAPPLVMLSEDYALPCGLNLNSPDGRATWADALLAAADWPNLKVHGKKLVLGRRVWLTAPSARTARGLARGLRDLGGKPTLQRQEALDAWLRRTLDVKAIQERWENAQAGLRQIQGLANLLFVYLFLVCPVAAWYFTLKRSWFILLAGLIVLDLIIARAFHRAHKALYPGDGDERFSHTFTVLLAPCSAIRAHDLLTRPLLEEFHPLAVASILARPVDCRTLATRTLRELLHPLPASLPIDDAHAAEVEARCRSRWIRMVEDFLQEHGLRPEELLRPPLRTESVVTRYCPRCLAQYTDSARLCPDCGGLSLMEFAGDSKGD